MENTTIKAEPLPLDPAAVAKLRQELKQLEWGLDSFGGAARLAERMKIIAVKRKLKAAGPSDV